MRTSDLKIEKELVKQFTAGSEVAFELIFHRSKEKLKGFLNKVLPHGEDVEGIMQEIFLKLWENRKSIKVDKKFETYLFAITRNLVVDVMRKRLHKQKYLEGLYLQTKDPQKDGDDILGKIEYSELEEKIYDLIERLPEKRRIIFKLSRIDGFTYKEIAKKLNISENTVDTQIRKALTFMRDEMKQYLSFILWIYLSK